MAQKDTKLEPQKDKASWPLPQALKLRALRYGTVLVANLTEKNKRANDVITKLDIPYTKNTKDRWLSFDWHYPKKRIKNGRTIKTPTIFYFHGGAWASADKSFYSLFCKNLAQQGFNVVNINYRLIPDYSFETAINNCIQAVNYILDNSRTYGIDRENVFFAGDSAGAHISALIAGFEIKNKIKLKCKIRGLVLYYGVYDFTKFYNHPFKLLQTCHNMFVSVKTKPRELENFYQKYSPINYITTKYPPCFLTSGKVDKLHKDSAEFASLLQKNDIKTDILFFEKDRKDARHAFLNLNNLAANEAFIAAIKFCKKLVKRKKPIQNIDIDKNAN